MSVAPLVRRVIVCEKVEVGRAEPGYPYTLHNVVAILRPPAGHTFPFQEQELWVFAQFSDGEGSHPVFFELVRQELESETVILITQLPPVHLSAGRFYVQSRGYKLTGIPFPGPGIYEFRVRCGGNVAVDEVRMEDRP